MASAKIAYAAKLKDPRWQKMRLQILERDRWTCQKCRCTDKTLHVHHMAYRWGQDPWDYSPELLLTLCEDCHAKESKDKPRALEELKEALALCSAHANNILFLASWLREFSFFQADDSFETILGALEYFSYFPGFLETICKAFKEREEDEPWNDPRHLIVTVEHVNHTMDTAP